MTPHDGITRRQLLRAGAAAGLGLVGGSLVAACGGDDAESGATTDSSDERSLVSFNGTSSFVAGIENRLPLGVADRDGLLPKASSPDVLTVTVHDRAGDAVGRPTEVRRHDDGLPRPYYPMNFELAAPGVYAARAKVDGVTAELAFQVQRAADVPLVRVGQAMPAVETPTTDDARGVRPVCTRDPACPLHDVSLAEALRMRRRVAVLVSTPAFCQVSICGPVLDLLLERTDEPSMTLIHAEVYTDPEKSLDELAPIMTELHLPFEPVLVVVGEDGRIAARLDTVFDRRELDRALHATGA